MDLLSFILFFLVVVPFTLIYFNRQRNSTQEIITLQKETNRLLGEILARSNTSN